MVNMCSHIIKPESQIEKPEQDSIFPERERKRQKGKKKFFVRGRGIYTGNLQQNGSLC
jgi:hypothetical protein